MGDRSMFLSITGLEPVRCSGD